MFASVVEAVQCATEIQQEISSQDSDRPNPHRMRFRIGINLGDVLVDALLGHGAKHAIPSQAALVRPPRHRSIAADKHGSRP